MRANVYLRNYVTKKNEKRFYLIVREVGQRDHQIHLGCVSRKVAEENRVKVLHEIYSGAYQRASDISFYFSEFCDKFINEFIKGSRSSRTLAHYEHHLEKAKLAFKSFKLNQIRREDIERYLNGLKIGNRTKNIKLSVLNCLFQKAIDWRYLAQSPVLEMRRWREESHGSKPITQQELGRIFDQANPWAKSVIKVMVYSGVRPGELSQLKLQDIDWENKVLKIVSDKERKTKSRKTRLVPLSHDFEEELKLLQNYVPNMFFGRSKTETLPYLARNENQKVYLFCHADGKPIKSFRRTIRTILEKAKIEGVTPHGLRKTFCTLLARQGVHPKIAQRLLGHSDVRLTMDIYTEIEDDQLISAIHSLPSVEDFQRHKLRIVGE